VAATAQRPRPSYVGLVISASLLALALVVWNADREVTTPRPEPAHRGGQIVASIRSEPRSFNRVLVNDQASDLISTLTQGRLVRINRSTFELEPWLAERWETSADGRTHTLHLRQGVTWSDGTPFTSADVLFSLQAAVDPRVPSVVTSSATVGGEPIRASAPDERTVVLTYPAPSGLGLRLLDGLPILPRHKLAAALEAGTFAQAWGTTTPPAELVGTGPFVVRAYHPGQRLVLERNPHYWRRGPGGETLPYLDRIVLEVVPEQNTELERLLSGAIDLTSSELRPEDHVPVRRAELEGKLKRVELGVATDADALWFCLKPEARRSDPRFAFVARREFRQAISHAVDREAFARTVFLGEAVPIWGPLTPGNRRWFSPNIPRYPFDLEQARSLLRRIGLEDRNGNGIVEDLRGTEARLTVITQRGIGSYERGTAVLRDQVARIGIALDIAPLEQKALIQRMLDCDYDAIYMRLLAMDLDPAGNLDFWLSSGSAHVWNRQQRTPATEWEQRIDTLMLEQAATLDPERRRRMFDTVQRILAEEVPILYFAAPRLYAAHSTRLRGVVPSVTQPAILWNADTLSVAR
jgi:peptide/nickel transport system substrate-binding protein